jgi:hypothetical protein
MPQSDAVRARLGHLLVEVLLDAADRRAAGASRAYYEVLDRIDPAALRGGQRYGSAVDRATGVDDRAVS